MNVDLSLFGQPTVMTGGEALVLPFERRTQLLVFLAFRQTWVSRAELATLLWPDQPSKLAYANLRKALFRLQSLAWADRVEQQGSSLRLVVATDVAAFEVALREHRTADAFALRGGEFLAGFDDGSSEAWSNWLGFERDRLRVAWRGAAQERLASDVDPGAAIELAARLLDEDPLDDAALQAYMAWLLRAGQGGRARQAYRDFARRLDHELGLAPSAELKALHDSIGAPVLQSAVPTAARPSGDDFIGRTVEVRRIAALLAQDDCRLLTITGPGGIGKTRLARRALDEMADRFVDGATFVPLEEIESPGELGARIAHALDVPLKGRSDSLDQVAETLRDRNALLVLDNFEHVVQGSRRLEPLLATCPHLKLLVTSRIRLALQAEWLLPLEGLACPDQEDRDNIESFDAARLFVRAARRVQPDLVPSVEADAIVEICRQVEGLPLALELAASWTRVLSCSAIAAELRHGMELLSEVNPTQPRRHASIEYVFDQSWRLLSDVERDVLAGLSVFSGSFTPEAARAIAGARLPVLAALADKSLLRRDGHRLRLHPLVHQLCGARLGDAAKQLGLQSAHADYFNNLLYRLTPGPHGASREGLATIDAEFDNCRVAWRFSVAHGDAAALRQSAPALVNYFEDRARFSEGLELLREALESALCQENEELKAGMLGSAALLELRLGQYAEADETARRALEQGHGSLQPATRFRALSVRAGCASNTGRFADSKRLYREALALARNAGWLNEAAATLENLALADKRLGNYDEALHFSMEALAQHRSNGDDARIALCLSNLGSFYMFLNRNDLAASHLKEALELAERHGLVSTRGYVLANLTELALKTRDAKLGQLHAERALEVAESTGMRALAGWLKMQLARLAAWRGDMGAAHRYLSAGCELALALDAPSLKAAALLALAELLEAIERPSSARCILAFAKDQASISAPDREELRAEWALRGETPLPSPQWPGLALDELMRRLVIEADAHHTALIADLTASA